MKTVKAMSQETFEELCYINNWNDETSGMMYNTAFISIIGTPDVLKYYLEEEDTTHWFKSNHENVLNLEFDDVDHDMEFHGKKAFAMTDEQAQQIVEFIENNFGKNIYIHCRAGVSRSQAITKFIEENYGYTNITEVNGKPNVDVLAKLNRVLWNRKFKNLA